ncbi:MAG: hypothetical protein BWZ10_00841 [candidate division BRC1 bacterium ADurb.BinA364]|nr:MAG: hypothetical protein BWZ10_00841 [candidate division BRC1 bacterium ADurb.BinA364]
MTDEQGAANLQLARGTWAIVLFSDPEWQKIHPDRAVFLKASPVELNRRQETLRLAPDSEIQVSFVDEAGSPLSADAIHAVDPALGAQIPFPSLGTAQGRLAMETAAGTALDILAQGRAANGDAWTCFASGAAAPAKMDWRPMGPQAARIDLRPPTLLSEIPSIKLAFTRYRHDPTQVEIGDLRPGMAVFLTPGKIELNYAVSCAIATYDYSPRQYDLRSGATLSLAMDSPTTASVFHQHYPAFYGSVKNVLAAGLIAKDANGHLLSKVLRPSGAPALISLAARDGDRPVGMAISDRGRFMEKMAHDVAASALPRLEYEIAAPLGPAIPKTLPGVDWTTVETRHFTIHAPPMLMDRVALLSEGVERLYDELRKMKGGAPSWQRTGLFFRTIMPPTSGGRSTAQGVLLPFAYLLTDRWLDIESIQKLPHELEHKFGFGHEDFMGVWANALYGAMGKNETPVIKPGPPPNAATQEGLLALLRGEPGANPGVAQWAMFRHGDIGPFREYQGIKQEWTAILQSQGFTDEETYCAIFSEFSQRDLAPLYLALGAIIRPDRYPQARDLAARLRRGEARESRRGADGEAQPLKKLDTAIAQAREKGGAEGAAILGEAADAWIRELPLNRTRCKQFMRLGAVYMELGAEEQACEAFRNVQREAMLVGRQYVNLCRRLALIGLTGAPPGLGHM